MCFCFTMIWYYGMVWYDTIWYGMIRYYIVCYTMAFYGIGWRSVVWYCFLWYCITKILLLAGKKRCPVFVSKYSGISLHS